MTSLLVCHYVPVTNMDNRITRSMDRIQHKFPTPKLTFDLTPDQINYLPKLSKLMYIISVSDISTASRRKSMLGTVGSTFWYLLLPDFSDNDIHRLDPSNLTAPCLATTKCAVARSGPNVSRRSCTNLQNILTFTDFTRIHLVPVHFILQRQ